MGWNVLGIMPDDSGSSGRRYKSPAFILKLEACVSKKNLQPETKIFGFNTKKDRRGSR